MRGAISNQRLHFWRNVKAIFSSVRRPSAGVIVHLCTCVLGTLLLECARAFTEARTRPPCCAFIFGKRVFVLLATENLDVHAPVRRLGRRDKRVTLKVSGDSDINLPCLKRQPAHPDAPEFRWIGVGALSVGRLVSPALHVKMCPHMCCQNHKEGKERNNGPNKSAVCCKSTGSTIKCDGWPEAKD